MGAPEPEVTQKWCEPQTTKLKLHNFGHCLEGGTVCEPELTKVHPGLWFGSLSISSNFSLGVKGENEYLPVQHLYAWESRGGRAILVSLCHLLNISALTAIPEGIWLVVVDAQVLDVQFNYHEIWDMVYLIVLSRLLLPHHLRQSSDNKQRKDGHFHFLSFR